FDMLVTFELEQVIEPAAYVALYITVRTFLATTICDGPFSDLANAGLFSLRSNGITCNAGKVDAVEGEQIGWHISWIHGNGK
ncbi:MAG: hypothetical protein ACRYF5_06475, partial [Janthinobacterium lividum]